MKEMNRWSISNLANQYEEQLANGQSLHLNEQDFLKLIEYYDEEGESSKALFVLEEAIGKYLFSVDFYIRKAELLMDLGQEEEALDVLGQANTFAPGSVEINLLRAEALNYLGKRNEALQVLDESKNNIPGTLLSEVLLMESLIYEHHKEYDAMFDILKEGVIHDPKNNEAVERLGLSIELTKQYEAGIIINEAIIDLHPYSHLAWYNLGNCHRALGNLEEAIEAFEYVIAIDEQYEYAYYECADLRFDNKQYELCIPYYLDLLPVATPSDTGDIHFKIAICYHLLAQYSEAIKHLHIAQKTTFFQDNTYFLLGHCSLMKGNTKEAAYYFTKAIALEPNKAEYYTNFAEVKIQEEDYQAAQQYFDKAISVDPKATETWVNYAMFYFDLGHTDNAFGLLDEAAHHLEPIIATYMRVAFLFLTEKRNEGSILLWEALLKDYDSHEIIFKIAPDLENDSDIRAIIAVV